MDGDKEKILSEEYLSRINRVQDYIESNISEEFSLAELSKVANFSPYHFHRIFSVMTGETLFGFIQRIRLEKAAFQLLSSIDTPIFDIALQCGFSNQASFAKAFKKYYGVTGSQFRNKYYINSNMGKVSDGIMQYNYIIRNKQCCPMYINPNIPFTVNVKELSDMNVVYIRHTGPYKEDGELFHRLFSKLYAWMDAKRAIQPDKTKWLTLFHDNPEITADDKLRISVCASVPERISVDGKIGMTTVEGGKYAAAHFELYNDQYQDAWNVLFARWFPQSGYQPDDRLSFELYSDVLANDGDDRHAVDIYIPIKPL